MSEQLRFTKPIAVLIDAENIQLSALSDVLAKCEQLGSVALKRAYGDFTLANLKDWSKAASDLSIHPIQQFRIINGKSVSDCALIIDAMDLLHSGRYGAFCIVSSDSDFTRLATRIREDGLSVFGFGESKTNEAFVSACNKFFDAKMLSVTVNPEVAKPKSKGRKPIPLKLLVRTVKLLAGENGHSPFMEIEAEIKKTHPEFTPVTYGYVSLREMFEENEAFEFVAKRGKRKSYVKLL